MIVVRKIVNVVYYIVILIHIFELYLILTKKIYLIYCKFFLLSIYNSIDRCVDNTLIIYMSLLINNKFNKKVSFDKEQSYKYLYIFKTYSSDKIVHNERSSIFYIKKLQKQTNRRTIYTSSF